MSHVTLQSALQIRNITTNKAFVRLSEKTQVCFPSLGKSEVVHSRLTHSYEVKTSSEMMAANICAINGWVNQSVDYQGSIGPCALLHDLGHPALNHQGSALLDAAFKSEGVAEGFCDNNNTLVSIEKNNIMVSAYTISSTIKYPHKLYPYQTERYLGLLENALKQDKEHFSSLGINLSKQTRTVACQIMDEADRNSYITGDLSDFICTGGKIPTDRIVSMAHNMDLLYRYSELNTLISILRNGDKTAIKAYFNNLANQFNMNYNLTNDGLVIINADLHAYREFLWALELEHYIKPLRKNPEHLKNVERFKWCIKQVLDNDISTSTFYRNKINTSTTKEDALRAKRDMIAEMTCTFISNEMKYA